MQHLGNILRILAALAVSAAMLRASGIADTVLLFAATAVHETGHYCAYLSVGCPPPRLRLSVGGLRFHGKPAGTYRAQAIVALGGAGANLLAAALLGLLSPLGDYPVRALFFQLLTAATALLPVLPLDGSRALHALLLTRLTPAAAFRFVQWVSVLLCALLLYALLLFLCRSGEMLYGAFFCFSLLFAAAERAPET